MDAAERTAHHEAGHTVAGIVLGLKVTEVTVERSVTAGRDAWEAFAGHTFVDLRDEVSTAIVNLAGPAASERLCPGDKWNGMEGDYRRADAAIDVATGDSCSFSSVSAYACRRAQITLEVRAAAEQITECHWPEVLAIANALLERKTIDGYAAVQLFEQSLHARGGRQWVCCK